jgi:hypothetical protein
MDREKKQPYRGGIWLILTMEGKNKHEGEKKGRQGPEGKMERKKMEKRDDTKGTKENDGEENGNKTNTMENEIIKLTPRKKDWIQS